MLATPLDEFIAVNREELALRCRDRLATMTNWPSTSAQVDRGIPLFLDQLIEELRGESSQTVEIRQTAVEHGGNLYSLGFTVSQVVHDYGNVCQCVTDLAVERQAFLSTSEFRTLNRCLDDAIAGAVSEHERRQRLATQDQVVDLQALVDTAIAALRTLQAESAVVTGMTGSLLLRSLMDMRVRLEGSSLPRPA